MGRCDIRLWNICTVHSRPSATLICQSRLIVMNQRRKRLNCWLIKLQSLVFLDSDSVIITWIQVESSRILVNTHLLYLPRVCECMCMYKWKTVRLNNFYLRFSALCIHVSVVIKCMKKVSQSLCVFTFVPQSHLHLLPLCHHTWFGLALVIGFWLNFLKVCSLFFNLPCVSELGPFA